MESMDASGDNLPLLGDWPPDTPRTKAFLSIILGEGLLPSQNGNEVPLPVPENQNSSTDSTIVADVGREGPNAHIAEFDGLRLPKPGFRSGLADRMAARGGFSAPKLNTCEFRSTNLSSSVDVKPHQIPLSPGFSPSAFLDSPVFMFNSLTQPSPTTGKFPLGQDDNTILLSVQECTEIIKDLPSAEVDAKAFAFQPHGESSLYSSSAAREVNSTVRHRHPLQSINVSAQPSLSNQPASLDASPETQQNNHPLSGFPEPSEMKESSVDLKFDNKYSDCTIGNENSPPPVDQLDGKDQNEEFCSTSDGQQSEEDWYNWRKYGQKLVKGSEFPRSYYKCTHLNCPVKKIVERGPNFQIIEIIYKGTHNHSMSTLSRRTSCSSSHSFGGMKMDGPDSQGRQASTMEGKPMWASCTDWRNNNTDATSASMTTEFNDPSTSMLKEDCIRLESSPGALDVSSTLFNEEEDGTIHCENEESEMKRRKLESSMIDTSSASRSIREPRVVVQTTSEVDILDDGYRWRKYGQKVVKGNPNPRSYYKCTSVGCTVRKHVERASHDLKSVITTYEGKHNHDVPAAKNSNHSTSASLGTIDILSQSNSVQRRQDPLHAQENFAKFGMPASMSNFSMMSAREQLIPPAGFSFGLGRPSLTSLEMAGLIPGDPMNVLTQMPPYLSQNPALGSMIRKVEPLAEQMIESSFPMSNGGSVYQQMMGRLPLGP